MDHNGLPEVRLGTLQEGGLAPAVMAIVDRGVRRRPDLARSLNIEVELSFSEQHPPVRITFGEHVVVVEDGPASTPDLRIDARLGDHIALMVAPVVGGLPSVFDARGRAALGLVVSRRVKFQGSLGLLRRFLGVIHV
jgi:hypothetical protein